jgi:hypothetical protein
MATEIDERTKDVLAAWRDWLADVGEVEFTPELDALADAIIALADRAGS